MRAAGYTRVSHKEQVEGHSPEAQAHSIRSFCTSRNWTLVHIYTSNSRFRIVCFPSTLDISQRMIAQ